MFIPNFLNCRHYFLVLRLVDQSDQRVNFGVDGVLEDERGEQVGQVCILPVLETDFDIEHVESDHRVVDESNEPFHLLDDSLE